MATVSPKFRLLNAAPPQPELFEMTAAKRWSTAPAQSAALPMRECPIAITRRESRSRVVAAKSISRLSPHAQIPNAPDSSGPGAPS